MRWKISIEGSDEITRGRRFEFEIEKNFDNLIDGSVGLSIDDGKTIMASLRSLQQCAGKLSGAGRVLARIDAEVTEVCLPCAQGTPVK